MPLFTNDAATARYRERHLLAERACVMYFAKQPLDDETVLKGLAIYEAASTVIDVEVKPADAAVDRLVENYRETRWYKAEQKLSALGIEQMFVQWEQQADVRA